MGYPQPPDLNAPVVEVASHPNVRVRVIKENRAGGGVLWSGKVEFTVDGERMVEMEVSLRPNKEDPTKHYVQGPSRAYPSGGQTKYLNTAYLHGSFAAAAQQAIDLFRAQHVEPPYPEYEQTGGRD